MQAPPSARARLAAAQLCAGGARPARGVPGMGWTPAPTGHPRGTPGRRACMMRVCSPSSWSPTRAYSSFSCATCVRSSRSARARAPARLRRCAARHACARRRARLCRARGTARALVNAATATACRWRARLSQAARTARGVHTRAFAQARASRDEWLSIWRVYAWVHALTHGAGRQGPAGSGARAAGGAAHWRSARRPAPAPRPPAASAGRPGRCAARRSPRAPAARPPPARPAAAAPLAAWTCSLPGSAEPSGSGGMGAGGPMPGCPCGCGERRPAAAARRPEEHTKELLRTLLRVTQGDNGMLLHPVGSRTPAMQARARRQARARLHGQLSLHGGRLLAQARQLGLQRAGLVGRGLQLAAQARQPARSSAAARASPCRARPPPPLRTPLRMPAAAAAQQIAARRRPPPQLVRHAPNKPLRLPVSFTRAQHSAAARSLCLLNFAVVG